MFKFMSLFPFKAWIIGDPHFTSLDGYQYTFNGLGDYQVGLIYDGQTLVYEIQGRTQRVVNKETGELGQATFFDAFAIRKENTTISFFLTSNNTDFSINIDDVEFNKTSLLEGDFENENFLLSAADGNLTTIFVIWRTLAVTIDVRSGLLDMLLQLPDQFKGDNTRGLIGVWNDDITDDFLLPNGTLLSPSGAAGNYTDEDFFLFGEEWRIDPADSFFDVGVSRPPSADSSGFMPVFLSNLVSSFEMSDPSFLNTARSGCNNNRQCLFDTLAAEDMELGWVPKTAKKQTKPRRGF
ncbi:putative fibrillin-1 [Apostichopus japonicus]|uniref:Putative fibrillin-1 n=1 Tax=Stichopus japonicus TaxID=307972 RepID=A0A2G8LPC9_STIJA|nr:putative fibrillin-1 [Apostichopus japonicus]